MNLLELFSGTGSVGTIAKSLGFNDARKMAVRLAEKWRSGWPKSGGQAGRKVAVRLAEKWRSGGQAGRKVAVRRSGWPKSGGQAVMSLISHRQRKEKMLKNISNYLLKVKSLMLKIQ